MAELDHDQVYQLAIQEGASPDEASFLAAVAGPESGYNTQAHNPNASTGDNSYGLLQINMLGQMGQNRAKEWGLSSYDDLYDPATNIRAGLSILRSQGKKAWTTYTSGAYKRYESDAPVLENVGATAGASAGTSKHLNIAGLFSGQSPTEQFPQQAPAGGSLGERLQSILGILGHG